MAQTRRIADYALHVPTADTAPSPLPGKTDKQQNSNASENRDKQPPSAADKRKTRVFSPAGFLHAARSRAKSTEPEAYTFEPA